MTREIVIVQSATIAQLRAAVASRYTVKVSVCIKSGIDEGVTYTRFTENGIFKAVVFHTAETR